MACKPHRKKPGPRTTWQLGTKYQRARCIERLKPNQVESLAAADAFARWRGTPLNRFISIHFQGQPEPREIFETSIDRISKWHGRWGGEWVAIHVWEATRGFHVHMACHYPKASTAVHVAIKAAFAMQDVHISARTPGQGMMAYLCKGTDVVTHAKIRGPRNIKARKQGVIPWKRCGTTQNIGKSAREKAGFDAKKHLNNCVKTSPRYLNVHVLSRPYTDSGGRYAADSTTYIVS